MLAVILQLIPFLILGTIFSIPVFLIARKRGENAWLWVVISIIPVIGGIAQLVFYVTTLMSILDRLEKLESEVPFR